MMPASAGPKNGQAAQQSTPTEHLPSFFDASRYPAYHAPHIDLMGGFVDRLRDQEKANVDAGNPAEDLADFLIRWFYAWEQRSVHMLREFFADDLVYADPTGANREFTMSRADLDLYSLLFAKVAPDLVFYPQDDQPRALPYYDFLDGIVRITVPWRAIGKFRFTPRHFDVVGVDRYVMIRDEQRGWLIQRIDTDLDLLGAFGQIMPFKALRLPKQSTQHRLLRFARRFIPALRFEQVRPFAGES
ncbi:Uncharacterised protein [Mycobacteroides abscessus subsp. abscessus]|nr:Uncharacterised protein [Mycobacteroides abscessus subsp. abscessus]